MVCCNTLAISLNHSLRYGSVSWRLWRIRITPLTRISKLHARTVLNPATAARSSSTLQQYPFRLEYLVGESRLRSPRLCFPLPDSSPCIDSLCHQASVLHRPSTMSQPSRSRQANGRRHYCLLASQSAQEPLHRCRPARCLICHPSSGKGSMSRLCARYHFCF